MTLELNCLGIYRNWSLMCFVMFFIREFTVFKDIVLVRCAFCVIHVCTRMVVSVYLSIHS